MFMLWRAFTTTVAALLAGLVGLGAGLLIAPGSDGLRARLSSLVNGQAPAVIENIRGAFGAVRDLADPPD